MNKDLDDRLIPNGEYRDAQNISVGKSEDDDIGALENVLGNTLIPPSSLGITDLEIIGYITDEYKDNVIVFATNYTDGTNFDSFPTKAPSTKRCIIYIWSPNTAGGITTLIDDSFLNFSTTNPIQATLIEELLFFTDNRNQPRKISVDNVAGYYTSEDQISVAKYSPWEPISLLKKETGIVSDTPVPTATVFTLTAANPNITVGMAVVSSNKTGTIKIQGDEFITVLAVNGAIITLSNGAVLPANDPVATDNFVFLESTMTNKSSEATWPGDPDFLEDKLVRFSYRFRFDDGEYSIMAPFTQIAYIPKQKGYYVNGDEDAAFRSTILDWMENNVDNVELLIPLPDNASTINASYKITHMDVLYKESDALVVKVLETLPIDTIVSNSTNNTCSYSYQSRKPYKTLTQAQTVRVYDKVPVRSLAQETAGNRIIYGNFRDIYTPPATIEYTVRSLEKTTFTSDSWIEYPNHSLKQNRSYQVGFILCDKFGRQSSVILSPVTVTTSGGALGSTIFSSYYSSAGRPNVKDWFGDALQVVVNVPGIESNTAGGSQPNFTTGEPGLYAIRTSTGLGFQISEVAGDDAVISGNSYVFKLSLTANAANTVIPVIDDYLRGEFIDYVKVTDVQPAGAPVVGTTYTVSTDAQVNSSYLNNFQNTKDIKYSFSINSTGWYSYKVVVKQTEQDYYNVYLPGILKGYPDQTGVTSPIPFPNDPIGSTSNIVLINDNINKVPRDLSEVGPDQKQFRSSVQLFGRVENTLVGTAADAAKNNIQYYPGTNTDTAINIATSNDSNMDFSNLSTEGQQNLYQIDSKPLIARLATSTSIGIVTNTTANINMQPFLAIYETEPVDSLLDIFWETTTVGMISDLNADVSTGFAGPSTLSFDFASFQEDISPGDAITDLVYPVSQEGAPFDASDPTTATAFSVTDNNGQPATGKFFLFQELTPGADQYKYQIKTAAASNSIPSDPKVDTYFTYENTSSATDVYTFNITVRVNASPNETATISIQGGLLNIDPLFSPALALITKTVEQEAIGTLSAFNGTNTNNLLSNKISQLQWTITQQVDANSNVVNYFSITPSSGDLTQVANTTPNGLYDITVTLKDSVLSGVQGSGGRTITGLQQVRVGPTPVNAGVKSTCVASISDASSQYPFNATIAPWDDSSTLTAVWYLSDSVLTGAARTTYLEGTGWPTGTTPSGTDGVYLGNGGSGAAATIPCYTIHKLGEQLDQGMVVLSFNMQLTLITGLPPTIEGRVDSLRVYHRVNSTAAWVSIPDINNHTIPVTGIQKSNGVALVLETHAVTDTYFLQYALAFNQVGEYMVVAVNTRSFTANEQSQALVTFVNSNDLNYSTCVIEDGVNTSSGTAQSYRYGISTTTGVGSYGCSFGTTDTYSNIAYGQYVQQFFTTSALTTPYYFATSATDSNNIAHSDYYAFKNEEVYTSPTNDHKYSFSTRFQTLNAKTYIPPTWGTNCYIQNCGNQASALSPSTCSPLALTQPLSLDTTTFG